MSFFSFGSKAAPQPETKNKGRPPGGDVVDKFAGITDEAHLLFCCMVLIMRLLLGLPYPLNLPLFTLSKVLAIDTSSEEDKKRYVQGWVSLILRLRCPD